MSPSRRGILAAALVGIAVFALYASQLAGLRDSLGNFAKYPVAAAQFAAGGLDAERARDFSPLYLRLCIVLDAHAVDPSRALVLIQCGCAAAAAGMLYLALLGHVGSLAALAGAAALALYPGLMAHAYVFEPEAMMVLWLAALLLFGRGTGAPMLAVAGAVLALCVLTRPGFVPLIAVIPAACVLNAPRDIALRASAAFLVSFLLVWAGLSVTLAPAPPSLATMNPGTVFYDGNNPLSDGVRAEYPELVASMADDFPGASDFEHALYRLVARRSEGRSLTRGEVNGWWAAKGMAYLIDHPGSWAASVARKLSFALRSHRWHDLRVAWIADRELSRRPLPLVPAAPVAALALAGFVLWRRRWKAVLIAGAGAGLQLLVMAATYASERQRLALWPFLCFFAAIGLHEIRVRRARLGPALAVVLLTVLFSLDDDLTRDDRETTAAASSVPELRHRTLELRDGGRLREAAESHSRSLALAPWAFPGGSRPERLPATRESLASRAEEQLRTTGSDSPTTRLHRALLLLDAGRLDEAESLISALKAEHARFLRRRRRPADPDYWLALIAVRRGEQARAVGLLRAAILRRPGDPQALAALFVLTGEPRHAALLERYFGVANAHAYLGLAALECGRGSQAVDALLEVAALLPESRDAKVALAAALFDARRFEAASQAYLEGMRMRAEPLQWEAQILDGLRGWAAQTPPDHFARYLNGKALRQFGRFAEARVELAAAHEASGRAAIAEELESLDADIATAGPPQSR